MGGQLGSKMSKNILWKGAIILKEVEKHCKLNTILLILLYFLTTPNTIDHSLVLPLSFVTSLPLIPPNNPLAASSQSPFLVPPLPSPGMLEVLRGLLCSQCNTLQVIESICTADDFQIFISSYDLSF